MATSQPKADTVVVPFTARQTLLAGLTPRDRMEIARWREDARARGYDRMVIHEREFGDAPDVGSFLSIYRRGEPWSSWGLTRQGGMVLAWATTNSTDLGPFKSVSEAMAAMLGTRNVAESAQIVAFASAICG